jgi:hypothetical protein
MERTSRRRIHILTRRTRIRRRLDCRRRSCLSKRSKRNYHSRSEMHLETKIPKSSRPSFVKLSPSSGPHVCIYTPAQHALSCVSFTRESSKLDKLVLMLGTDAARLPPIGQSEKESPARVAFVMTTDIPARS